MPEGFPERLKRIRKSKGLSQCKLAEIVGIEQMRISNYENNKSSPSIDVLEWLCQALGVSSKDLLGF